MPRKAAKVDKNHGAIVTALRQIGAKVQSLAALGKDVPDLLVGYRGTAYLLEVKSERGKVTDGQAQWLAEWPGPWAIVRTPEEAIQVVTVGKPN
jgi:hypothetical protein